MSLTTVTSSRSIPSRWPIFTPAVNPDTQEVDLDCLMDRVHRLFVIAGAVSAFNCWKLAYDPSTTNFVLFLAPIVILVIAIEVDERIALAAAKKMKARKVSWAPDVPASATIRVTVATLGKSESCRAESKSQSTLAYAAPHS